MSELISGKVEVQSSARRSYKAVVIPTDALLTLGMLKLTSLIMGEQMQGTVEQAMVNYECEYCDGPQALSLICRCKACRCGEINFVKQAVMMRDSMDTGFPLPQPDTRSC